MPVGPNGVGYSGFTQTKEDDFRYIARTIAGKVCGIQKSKQYKDIFLYFDPFAGSGFNYEVNCPGSPVVVIEELKRLKLQYHAVLVDQNKENCESLRATFKDQECRYGQVEIHHSDCRPVILWSQQLIEGTPHGLMIVDPNGNPYFEMIRAFYSTDNTEKIDLCIRLGSVNYKRCVGAFGWSDLRDSLEQINKKYWFVKYPESEKYQWTTIFGTNSPVLKLGRNHGFNRVDTPFGEAVLNDLNHTRKDDPDDYKNGQLPLKAFFNGGAA